VGVAETPRVIMGGRADGAAPHGGVEAAPHPPPRGRRRPGRGRAASASRRAGAAARLRRPKEGRGIHPAAKLPPQPPRSPPAAGAAAAAWLPGRDRPPSAPGPGTRRPWPTKGPLRKVAAIRELLRRRVGTREPADPELFPARTEGCAGSRVPTAAAGNRSLAALPGQGKESRPPLADCVSGREARPFTASDSGGERRTASPAAKPPGALTPPLERRGRPLATVRSPCFCGAAASQGRVDRRARTRSAPSSA
jgi:hypothetical protein